MSLYVYKTPGYTPITFNDIPTTFDEAMDLCDELFGEDKFINIWLEAEERAAKA